MKISRSSGEEISENELWLVVDPLSGICLSPLAKLLVRPRGILVHLRPTLCCMASNRTFQLSMKARDQTIGCRMVFSRSHAGNTRQMLQILVEHVGFELSSLVGLFPWWSAKQTSKFPGSTGHIAPFPLPCSAGVQLGGNFADTVKAVSESLNRQRIGMGRCGYGQTVKRATRKLQQVSDCGAWLWT